MRRILFLTVIALLVYAWAASDGRAAEISDNLTTAERDMGCTLAFRGQIAAGDAARAIGFMEQYMRDNANEIGEPASGAPTGRICFDSPGGDLAETIHFLDFLITGNSANIGSYNRSFFFKSAVADGGTCLSSCALLFLSGTNRSLEDVYSIDFGNGARLLHPRAELGFHSPSLPNVPDGLTAQQVRDIFSLGAQAVSEIVRVRDEYPGYMSDALFEVWTSTPFDEMRFARTVGDAATWNISVFPVFFTQQSIELRTAFRNMCANALLWYRDHANLDGSQDATRMIRSLGSVYQLTSQNAQELNFSRQSHFAVSGATYRGVDSLGQTSGCVLSVSRQYNNRPGWFRDMDVVGLRYDNYTIGNLSLGVFSYYNELEQLIAGSNMPMGTQVVHASMPADFGFLYRPEMRLPDLVPFRSLEAVQSSIENGIVNHLLRAYLPAPQETVTAPMPTITAPNLTRSCTFSTSSVTVINVNEFVNIRSDPSLRAPIVTRAMRGERLSLVDRNTWWVIDTPRGLQCLQVCERVVSEPELRPLLLSCIEDAEIWHAVRNNRGQTGYVSHKFLE